MAIVELRSVTLRYPQLSPNARSLQLALYSQLGSSRRPSCTTGEVEALQDINLHLGDGDRLGVIGQNGAGKTTLLRVIAGVYKPQIGSVRVEGRLASYTDFMLGMDGEASGWDNIVFRCVFLGLTFREARDLAPSIAEFSGIEAYLGLPVRTYSSGMLIRLAFSITTAIQPDVLVMDEMIGAADAEFLSKAQRRLNSIMERAAILVLSSHDMALLKAFCRKVAWMEKGRIRALGDPDEVTAAYLAHALAAPAVTS